MPTLIKLFKEVFFYYKDQFMADRAKKSWKENLCLVFFGLAGVVLLIVVVKVVLGY